MAHAIDRAISPELVENSYLRTVKCCGGRHPEVLVDRHLRKYHFLNTSVGKPSSTNTKFQEQCTECIYCKTCRHLSESKFIGKFIDNDIKRFAKLATEVVMKEYCEAERARFSAFRDALEKLDVFLTIQDVEYANGLFDEFLNNSARQEKFAAYIRSKKDQKSPNKTKIVAAGKTQLPLRQSPKSSQPSSYRQGEPAVRPAIQSKTHQMTDKPLPSETLTHPTKSAPTTAMIPLSGEIAGTKVPPLGMFPAASSTITYKPKSRQSSEKNVTNRLNEKKPRLIPSASQKHVAAQDEALQTNLAPHKEFGEYPLPETANSDMSNSQDMIKSLNKLSVLLHEAHKVLSQEHQLELQDDLRLKDWLQHDIETTRDYLGMGQRRETVRKEEEIKRQEADGKKRELEALDEKWQESRQQKRSRMDIQSN